jgi:hypothetical protein
LGESAADVKDVIFGQLLQNFIFKQLFVKSKVESGSVLTGVYNMIKLTDATWF